jgi:hypothetical protein
MAGAPKPDSISDSVWNDAHIAPHPGKSGHKGGHAFVMPDDDRVPLEKGKSREVVQRNVRKLLGAGHNEEAAKGIAERKARGDDNQHMGFTEGFAEPIKKLVSQADALISRMDAFEKRRAMKKVKKVKPRTKDNMQPSMPHPKEPGG